ncbi:MAG: hypothetical protein IKN17_02790 [Ruminococcus sp.]|nr:hypothetical protein [Ruminococcus sp.]
MVRKNLKSLIRNEPALFAVMLVCVFSSALLLCFSYGLYQNYNVKLIESNAEYKELTLEVNEGKTLTKGELCSFIEALPQEVTDNVWLFYVSARVGSIADHRPVTDELRKQIADKLGRHIMEDDEGNKLTFDENTDLSDWDGALFYFRFRYQNGAYKLFDTSQVKGSLLSSGRMYSDEEYGSGAHVTISTDDIHSGGDNGTAFLINGNKAWLWGEEYEIIGNALANSIPTPPITAAPDGLVLEPQLYMAFTYALTKSQYHDIRNTAENIFPGMFRFDELSFPDSESRYVYNNIILISLLIAFMSAVNFVMLYRCILNRRSRTTAILRLCGCSTSRALLCCIAECFIIGVPAFAAGTAVYIPLMKRRLSAVFPYMEGAYSFKVYALIFAGYILMMLTMTGLISRANVRQSIAASVSGRR